MADPRYRKFASALIHYALGIVPGDKLLISSTPLAAPLLGEVVREALRAGAHPETRIELADTDSGGTRVTMTITHEPTGGGRGVRRLQRGAMRRLVQRTVDAELDKVPAHVALASGSR